MQHKQARPANEAHNFDSKCVRLYSLMEQQYVHVHRMRTRVHGILSRPNALIIVTEQEIVCIDPMNDEKLWRKSCAPNPINGVVAALGNRWFAFADYKVRQTQNSCKDIHILPRNLRSNHNNYLSPTSSPKLKEKKSKKMKMKMNKNAHLSIYDSNDDDDDDEQKENNCNEPNAAEFGGLGIENAISKDTSSSAQNAYYGMMTNQFDEISKTVQNTVNAMSASTMQFIQDSFTETRKDFKNSIKRKQKVLKRKRDEMRAKEENVCVAASSSNNLYCDAPPKQGIVSIIDYKKGELLINFVAHSNAPLMYIAFDPSGSLLVTADRDGIYLNVFQVIGFPVCSQSAQRHDEHHLSNDENGKYDAANGDNNAKDTVYRHLYRIYRGFRYAIIRDISFSADSKWMAVSSGFLLHFSLSKLADDVSCNLSARGTIHIYAINREGGSPSYRTHNNCYSINSIHDHHRFGAMDSLSIDIAKIYELQSAKKLHHEMKETRKDPKGTNTTTGGTKIISTFAMFGESTAFGSMSLLVQTPIAFHQYSLNAIHHKRQTAHDDPSQITTATATTMTEQTENVSERDLFLEISHLHEFSSRDLYNAQSVSYPYLHDQLYPQSTPYLSSANAMMSAFTLDEVNKDALSCSTNYDEDTKRWLSQTELHPINRFHEVSLWGNPQFNFFAYSEDEAKPKEITEEIPDIEEYQQSMDDPYSFLDVDLIQNATQIKLHEDSPIIGPRLSQPQIQTKISDLQQTIDSAMDTVIDDDGQRQNMLGDEDEDEFDADIPVPTKAKKGVESNETGLYDAELSLMLNEKYCKKLTGQKSQESGINEDENEQSLTGSDDFQMIALD